jgi:hypothetical protein
MDPRSDRTLVVRSRLMNILSLRMQAPAPSTTLISLNSNAHPALPPADEPVNGRSGDGSPPLPQVPPISSGTSGPSDTARRALTPIIERASVSERDPRQSIISGAGVASSPEQSNNLAPVPNEDRGQEQVVEVTVSTSPSQLSTPSVYAPTEVTSIAIEPQWGNSRELSREASVLNPSLETTNPFANSVSNERPSVDDSRPPDIRVASSSSTHSVRSSATSPPSLSPANSTDPPASLSQTQLAQPAPTQHAPTQPAPTQPAPTRPAPT